MRTQNVETSETPILDKLLTREQSVEGRRFFALAQLADRWGVSLFSIRRQVAQKNLRVINIGARLLVPADEVLRVETQGVGERKRRPRPGKSAKHKAVVAR